MQHTIGAMSGLFDIVGPVMVGPSSSHTAGAVRLAILARNIAQKPIQSVRFDLYNSFAKTYKGHGTDRGLLAGMMGFSVQDDRIRDAYSWAEKLHLEYEMLPIESSNHFSPNTVVFKMILEDGENLTVVGHSIGGGKVYVSKINDYNVSLKGEFPTLLLFYKDQPGMIWQASKVIAEKSINIASLTCTRRKRGIEAFMSIALDAPLPSGFLESFREAFRQIPDVYSVRAIDQLPL
ncbi:MAG: L-serine ammonia-lyase, iron-sulfur-dependent subunit beta [Cyanobacteria bacterium]|nr:L-serine ammonia-lyase, iron-sulfur-dependent subunit beta [Cyanobacteriota bacterium]